MIKYILIVGLGGGVGSMLRYAVQKLLPQQDMAVFPAGTFFVNVTGCLLIGLLWGWFSRSGQWNEEIKLLLMTGLCGGFTTFSAFTLEGIGLLKESRTGLFFLYTAASVLAGLLATYCGMRIAN